MQILGSLQALVPFSMIVIPLEPVLNRHKEYVYEGCDTERSGNRQEASLMRY